MTKATLLHASAHDTGLPDKSVHMIATSPPYFGLRKYAGAQDVEWPTVEYTPMAGLPAVTVQGCEDGCVHKWGDLVLQREQSGRSRLEWTTGGEPAAKVPSGPVAQGAYCVYCGGWRGPLGLEPDPLAYVAHIVLVFRELWRVLRDDGVAFLNLGDSYNGSGGAGGDYAANGIKAGQPKYPGRNSPGLKPKDLCMIPARVALALQADGWYLRSAIVWAKGVSFLPDYAGSVMPESVTDRPTKAHEDVYLLSKRAKYYFDAEAVKEESTKFESEGMRSRTKGNGISFESAKRNGGGNQCQVTATRNLRDVWVINPAGYAGAHFATWPEALVRPMVLAGSSARGVCPACAAPWRRVVERESAQHPAQPQDHMPTDGQRENGTRGNRLANVGQYAGDTRTLGWEPSCTCDAGEPVPATILDPFSGSGTTGRVAMALGRNYIGVDIAGEYHDTLADARLSNLQMEMTL